LGQTLSTPQFTGHRGTRNGMGSELMHKIKTNPWKTIGTALLATTFPVGTIIAGVIAAGVVAKSGYDSRANRKSSKSTAGVPQPHKQNSALYNPHKQTQSIAATITNSPAKNSKKPSKYVAETLKRVKQNSTHSQQNQSATSLTPSSTPTKSKPTQKGKQNSNAR